MTMWNDNFVCFLFCAFSYIPSFNQQNAHIKYYKTGDKTHFILGANSYMFLHQDVLINSLRIAP
jgi:uncharacterized protein YcsI (UPF0317 family)